MKFIALPSGLLLNLELVAGFRRSPAAKCIRVHFPASYTKQQQSGTVFGGTITTLAWIDLDAKDSAALLRELEQEKINIHPLQQAISGSEA